MPTSTPNQRPLLLRNRNFAYVWLGQVLSQGGSKAYLINLIWWIVVNAKDESQAATQSGILLILTAMPGILFAIPIGHLISRFSSKALLVIGEFCAALLVAAIWLLLQANQLNFPVLCALSFAIACCQAVVDPTLTHATVQLVAAEDVEGAVGLEASTQSMAYFIGTGLGASLTGMFGLSAALFLNIASYVISACATLLAHFQKMAAAQDHGSAAQNAGDFRAMGVHTLLYCFAAANFFMFPVFLVLPIFTKNVLQQGVAQLGMLEACFWLGLISGAFASKYVFKQLPVHQTSGRLMLLFGTFLAAILVLPNLYFTGLALFVGGSAAGIINVKVISYFQRVVPDHAKGHFFAKLQGFITSAQPLGYCAFTFFLANLDSSKAFAAQGLGLCLVGMICLLAAGGSKVK